MMCIGVFVVWNDRANSPGWIVEENGCHIWIGSRDTGGYGRVWDKDRRREQPVHRLRYEREIGPAPIGLEPDHLCRQRACCNPLHLEWVTHSENVLRGRTIEVMRARAAAGLHHSVRITHCPRGHEYTKGNTCYNAKGARLCRTCKADRQRARRARLRSQRTTPPRHNGAKTHCKRGHPFDEVNTYFLANGSGRSCRTCLSEHRRAYEARKKAQAALAA